MSTLSLTIMEISYSFKKKCIIFYLSVKKKTKKKLMIISYVLD